MAPTYPRVSPMRDEIKPALTAEEWKNGYVDRLGPPERPIKASDLLVVQMATANHALPADHPLKFTRQDVADLQRACDIIDQIEDGHVWRRYVRLRDKLAALLPPENPR